MAGFNDKQRTPYDLLDWPLYKKLVKVQPKLAKVKDEKLPEKPIKWSIQDDEWSITFDKSDCPENIDLSCRNPILVHPTIYNYKVSRVLMDGGSALNLLAAKTLDNMQVPRSMIQPVRESFLGLAPESSFTAIGQVTLPVTFGVPENFRTEMVRFEVVDFGMTYDANAILERPAFAQFMAFPNYAYQCMKMPGPNGVITILSSERHVR